MSSRMEKYDNISLDNMSRTKRNQNVYNSTDMSKLSRIKTNTNVSIISDAPKEIDIEKIKNYVYSLDEEKDEKKRRISLELPKEEEVVVERKQIKEYDINSILEQARDKRESDYEEERHRKINNTQIDILKNIAIKEEMAKDDDITGPIDELNTEEKTIVDLIKDIQSHGKKKELFEDLMADENDTTILAPIDDESNKENIKEALLSMTQDLEAIKIPENDFTREINLEKIKYESENDDTDVNAPKIKEIDKSFYTNSMSFNKSDFEGFEDLEKSTNKSSLITKLAVVFIIILLLSTVLLTLNYVLDWNII